MQHVRYVMEYFTVGAVCLGTFGISDKLGKSKKEKRTVLAFLEKRESILVGTRDAEQ